MAPVRPMSDGLERNGFSKRGGSGTSSCQTVLNGPAGSNRDQREPQRIAVLLHKVPRRGIIKQCPPVMRAR